jgi:hypothetical protein
MLSGRIHDQIHVFHRHGSQHHFIAQDQSAHKATATLKIHP